MASPWLPQRMITFSRAESVAKALFPGELAGCWAPGGPCADPCPYCLEARALWVLRICQVREAMLDAFK